LISRLGLSEAEQLLDGDTLSKGMLPKLRACVKAIAAGVSRAHILNGTISHALLLEIFTNEGVGTMIMTDKNGYKSNEFTAAPVDNLASKLHG